MRQAGLEPAIPEASDFKSEVYANSTTTANKNIIPHARGLVNVEVDQPRFFLRQMSNAAPVERAISRSPMWFFRAANCFSPVQWPV